MLDGHGLLPDTWNCGLHRKCRERCHRHWLQRKPLVSDPRMHDRKCVMHVPCVRLQNLPWSKTGLVSGQVLHPLSKLQNWIWSKTGRFKTGLVSNTKIEASLRATKPKPWQSNLTSDTVEIFIQNEKAGLVPMQSRFRSRHKAGLGAGTKPVLERLV